MSSTGRDVPRRLVLQRGHLHVGIRAPMFGMFLRPAFRARTGALCVADDVASTSVFDLFQCTRRRVRSAQRRRLRARCRSLLLNLGQALAGKAEGLEERASTWCRSTSSTLAANAAEFVRKWKALGMPAVNHTYYNNHACRSAGATAAARRPTPRAPSQYPRPGAAARAAARSLRAAAFAARAGARRPSAPAAAVRPPARGDASAATSLEP